MGRDNPTNHCSRCGAVALIVSANGWCAGCNLASLLKSATDRTAGASLSLRDIPSPGSDVARLGDYELLEAIAQGGMGVVYKARQRSLNRIVALKLLLGGGHASADFKKRFQQEAETAAKLHHSNIVPIYEVGEHEGQPFFSMEFVAGKNLAQMTQPLPPEKAAEYMECVARTMIYAHQQGVVHRDLKPSNILLGLDDRPRITDFGLAGRMDNDSSLTVSGEMLGTPGYLPPEQASVKKGGIGPHSDIYAIGAVLYFLLTGRPPFLAGTLADTLHQVLSAEPISARRLNPAIPRDLETICLKCLEKEPARRYGSVEALAEDLRRFREGKSILARPVSVPERVMKWYRREPMVAGLLTAVVLILLLGLSVSTWLLFRERAAYRAAEAEKQRADEQATTTAEISTFMVKDFLWQASGEAQIEAGHKPNPNLTVREMLDRAELRIGNRFQNLPRAEITIRLGFGEAFTGIGEPDRAIPHLRRLVELQRSQHGADAMETIEAMNYLALAYQDAGRSPDALPLLEESLQLVKVKFGLQDSNTLILMNNLASSYRALGKTNEAVQLREEVVKLKEASQGRENPDTLMYMHNLAVAYQFAGRLEEAIQLFDETLRLQKTALPLHHPDTLATMYNLGFALRLAREFDRAIPMNEETVKLRRTTLGDRDINTHKAMEGLGLTYQDAGKHDEATKVFRQLLELRKNTLGTNDYLILWTSGQLAYALLAREQFAEAEALLFHVCNNLTSQEQLSTGPRKLLQEAGSALIKLYETSGKPDKADVWRQRLKNHLPDEKK